MYPLVSLLCMRVYCSVCVCSSVTGGPGDPIHDVCPLHCMCGGIFLQSCLMMCALLCHCCVCVCVCAYSGMEVCVPPLLEVLVTLSHDVYPQVSSTAHSSLQLLPRTAQELSLTSMLGEQLHSLVTSLPRLIRQHDDTR